MDIATAGSPKQAEKPRYFEIVGWSWFVFSLLGLLFSLLSCFSFGQIEEAKSLITKQYALILPEVGDMFAQMMDWVIPLTLTQTLVMGLATVASWKFIQRKEWARWVLVIMNYGFILMTGAAYFWTIEFMNKMLGLVMKWRTEPVQLISYFHPLGLLMIFLLVAPLILMAWYFHWKPVRAYFH